MLCRLRKSPLLQHWSFIREKIFRITLFSAILFSLTQPATYAGQTNLFASSNAQIFDHLVMQIERIDAQAIDIRNEVKKVDWEEFKQHIRGQFVNAESHREFSDAVEAFNSGFINSHSYIRAGPASRSVIDRKTDRNTLRSDIGFTLPKIRFFRVRTGEYLNTINNISIDQLFTDFVDYDCKYAHMNACAQRFVEHVELESPPNNRTVAGTIAKPTQASDLNTDVGTTPIGYGAQVDESCAGIEGRYKNWKLIHSGSSLCLFLRSEVALLKIKYFPQSVGQLVGGLYCKRKNQKFGTSCGEIQGAVAALKSVHVRHLIIDVQNNPGGGENTPFISMLSQGEFFDNRVQYRCIEELFEDSELRRAVFYFSGSAERWFRSLGDSVIRNARCSNKYLGVRADFCRASRNCKIDPMLRDSFAPSLKNMWIVTNGRCVSSCDDLVWRLKEYSGAKIVGAMPVTDSTYSTIFGTVIIDENGHLSTQLSGNGHSVDLEVGSEVVVEFRVPLSRTVDVHGIPIDGQREILDQEYPIDTNTYRNADVAFVDQAYSNLEGYIGDES